MKIIKFLTAFSAAVLIVLTDCVEQPFENVDNTIAGAKKDFSYEIPVNAMTRLTLSAVNLADGNGSISLQTVNGNITMQGR